jgi:hypothetical protein
VGTGFQNSRSTAERAGLWALGLLVVPLIVLLGGGGFWVAVIGLACALALATARGASAFDVRSPLVLGLFGLTLFTFAQLLPLPEVLASWVAPSTVEFSSDLPGASSWLRISLDPAATALEVAKWAYAALIVAAAVRHAQIFGLEGILGVVGLAGLGLAVVSLGHLALSADSVFGIYRPLSGGRALGPILNPNHLASLENLAALCWLALWLGRGKATLPRSLQLVGAVVCIVTSIVTSSRGGVLSLLLSLFLIVIALGTKRQSRRAVVLGGILVAAVALGYFSLSTSALTELQNKDLSKIQVLRDLGPPIRDNMWLGVGRGAFGAVTQSYLGSAGGVVYRSIECFPVHWIVEWGAPVGCSALGLLVWSLWPARLGIRHSFRSAVAYVGVGAVLLQNLLDIGLELPGIAGPFWMVIGALEGSRAERGVARGASIRIPAWLARATLFGTPIVLGMGLLLASFWGPSVFEERLLAYELFRGSDEAKLLRRLDRDERQFPAEPYFWELRAHSARKKGQDALPFASRALRRAPKNGRSHLLVAAALHDRGALHQSLRHLAWAVGYDPSLGREAADRALRWTTREDELELAIPNRNAGTFLLPLVEAARDPNLTLARRRWIERAARENPNHVAIQLRLGTELVQDLVAQREPCEPQKICPLRERAKWEQRVEEVSGTISRLDPSSCAPQRLRAAILSSSGNLTGADDLLRDACPSCTDGLACLRERISIADRIGDSKLIRATESLYGPLACRSDYDCARAYEWLGTRAQSRREWGTAAHQFQMVTMYESTPKAWLDLARALLNLAELGRAEEALRRARAEGGQDPALDLLLAEARQAALRRALRP